jgi:hypothetical protein
MRTTGEVLMEQAAPFTIDVDAETPPRALHAALTGTVGVGVGDEGEDEEPPPQAVSIAASKTDGIVRTTASYRQRQTGGATEKHRWTLINCTRAESWYFA